MSDTIQIVRWTLGHSCKLRNGAAVTDPTAAMSAIADAETVRESIRRPRANLGVFGDVFVMDCGNPQGPKQVKLPIYGFVPSKAYQDVGGPSGLAAMCGVCPANSHVESPLGCAGAIYPPDDSSETQLQLEGIISRLELGEQVAATFLQTKPIWYGLWARSPLTPIALQLLWAILKAMYEEDAESHQMQRRDHLARLQNFIRAIELAGGRGLPLHVSMDPPGHVDFDMRTVFPHCPVCKAESGLKRWKRKYSTEPYTCRVCGTVYSPAQTERSQPDEYPPMLRPALGDRFPAFLKSYLMSCYATRLSEAEVDGIVALDQVAHATQQEKKAEERRQQQRKEQFIREVLFAGLHPTHATDEDIREKTGTETDHSSALLNAEEFGILLAQCRDRGISVVVMYHPSELDELDKYEFVRDRTPNEIFAEWQKAGCNERFAALLSVPNELVGPIPDVPG